LYAKGINVIFFMSKITVSEVSDLERLEAQAMAVVEAQIKEARAMRAQLQGILKAVEGNVDPKILNAVLQFLRAQDIESDNLQEKEEESVDELKARVKSGLALIINNLSATLEAIERPQDDSVLLQEKAAAVAKNNGE
jgi:hypothetical protein